MSADPSADHLVAMANQIAAFFNTQPNGQAVAGTCDHLIQFWNPVMIRELIAALDQGASAASPIVVDAVAALRLKFDQQRSV